MNCSYCRISGNIEYKNKPKEYPSKSYYYENERSITWWISMCDYLLNHNPNIFFIIYGGEPFIRNDVEILVKFLNFNDANYTIISNAYYGINSKKRMDDFFSSVGKVNGFTTSIDPTFMDDAYLDDEIIKSKNGFQYLKSLIDEDLVDDPVAEITCDNESIFQLEDTIRILDSYGITSDVTVLDIAKNDYYDFSDVVDDSRLVEPYSKVRGIFKRLVTSNYKIHMKTTLLPKILNILPSGLDCGLDKSTAPLHSITIDSDGKIRLCLRIRGIHAPKYEGTDLIDQYDSIRNSMARDKCILCEGCNHTCYLMSQLNLESIIDHGE